MARGQTGTIVRKHNDVQFTIRFDVEGDFRPRPGHELIQQEAIIFVGEITKLDGSLP